MHELPDSVVERRVIAVPGGLGGKRMEFVGLQGTITDVLVPCKPTNSMRLPPKPPGTAITLRSTTESASSCSLGFSDIGSAVGELQHEAGSRMPDACPAFAAPASKRCGWGDLSAR